MGHRMLQYRGSLKSCNYACSYCPFSKRASSREELERDRLALEQFRQNIESCEGEAGAIQLVPYGEALIHDYYWVEMAKLSRVPFIQAVGAQTNLSFPVEHCTKQYVRSGGSLNKLRLWCSFHPQMVSVPDFTNQCLRLLELGISFCAGAVGVPDNLELLERLREALPGEIYLWVNRMDGLGRRYTEAEIKRLETLDPWFRRELAWRKAEPLNCSGRLFQEADGSRRRCAIDRCPERQYQVNKQKTEGKAGCGRKLCSCFLAYGGRMDLEGRIHFGRFPLFRIPWEPDAFFIDLDGTLLPENKDGIEPGCLSFLQKWSEKCLLFAATSLPYQEAMRRLGGCVKYLAGGIFAGGAHVLLYANKEWERKEYFCPLPDFPAGLPERKKNLEQIHTCRIAVFENEGQPYKITIARPKRRAWTEEEMERIKEAVPLTGCRWFLEGNCFQAVSFRSDKAEGMRRLCGWLGLEPAAAAAAGNSEEDIPMLKACGYAIAMPDSKQEVLTAADEIIPLNMLHPKV